MLLISKVIPLFIYPLGLAILVMLFIALFQVRSHPRLAALSATTALILWSCSTPYLSSRLARAWAIADYQSAERYPSADAIVVLGGGIVQNAGSDSPALGVSGHRLMHGIALHRANKAPQLLLSGGTPFAPKEVVAEASGMARLARQFGMNDEDLIIEPLSANTFENAYFTAELLRPSKARRILLVTSYHHMRRSVATFETRGFEVIPAVSNYPSSYTHSLLNYLPDVYFLLQSSYVIKEWIGMHYYRLRGWITSPQPGERGIPPSVPY